MAEDWPLVLIISRKEGRNCAQILEPIASPVKQLLLKNSGIDFRFKR